MRRSHLLVITATLVVTGLAGLVYGHNVRLTFAATPTVPDTFVVKYDFNGGVISGWDPRPNAVPLNAALKYDSGGNDLATGIAATNPAGTIYAATGTKVLKYNTSGALQSTLTIGTTTDLGANNTIATVPSNATIPRSTDFIAVNSDKITRYDASGNTVWVSPTQDTVSDLCGGSYVGPSLWGVATDNTGSNVYATGYDYKNTTCDRRLARTVRYPATVGSVTSNWDVFSPTSSAAGDLGYGHDVAVASDAAARVYIAMSYNISPGFRLNKLYTSTGAWGWNSANLGVDSSSARAVAIDNTDNVYAAGWYRATSTSNFEFYIVKYSSANSKLWEKGTSAGDTIAGDTYNKYAHGIVLDGSYNPYVVGRYVGQRTDALIKKYNADGTAGGWVQRFDMGQKEEGYAVTADSTGIYVEGDFYESKPDLTVSGLTTPIVSTGDLANFSGTVYNGGETDTAASPASKTRLRIDIDNDGTYNVILADRDTVSVVYETPQTKTWNGSTNGVDAWLATGSQAKYEICADATNVVTESDETNNCRTATFSIYQKLTVTVIGPGTVTATTGGINCPGTCYAGYVVNTGLTLTATPNSGAVFSGWSGDADCSDGAVIMGGPRNCTATFINVAAPTVISPTKSGIASTSATLGATVTDTGGSALTARGTCWGTSAAPTTNCLAEGGTTTGAFTHSRTGMAPNTAYYYRGYASNSASTGYSSDDPFTTLPDVPTNLNFTNVQETTLTVNWSAPVGGSVPLTYKVERGNSSCTSFPTTIYSGGLLTANDAGLIGNTTYCYRVSATNNGTVYGNSSTGSQLTKPGVPTYPVLPTPTFTNVTAKTLTLSWISPTGGAASYKVWRSASVCTSFSQIGASDTPTYNDIGPLIGNTTFCYMVSATNTTGDSDNSSNASQLTVPDKPGIPSFSNITSSSVKVSWSPPSGPSGGLTYKLERCTNFLCTPNTTISSGITVTDYTDSPLSNNTIYGYRVYASNSTGEGVASFIKYATITNFQIIISQADNSPNKGSGTVGFSGILPALPDCTNIELVSPSGCTRSLPSGTVVTMTAAEVSSSTFRGWSGDVDCYSVDNTSQVTLSVPTVNCTVKFTVNPTFSATPIPDQNGPPESRNPQVTSGGYPIVINGTGFGQDYGRLVYGEFNNPDDRFRVFNGSSFSSPSGTGGTQADNEITWEKVVRSPLASRPNEYIAGRLESYTNHLYVQTCLNISGCDMATDWARSLPRGFTENTDTALYPIFDIAYEQNSGDGLAVWRDSVGYNDKFNYRTWNSATGSWSSVIPQPDTSVISSGIHFVKLVPKPNSDEIALVWSDLSNNVHAVFWDGSAWVTSVSDPRHPTTICSSLENDNRWSFDAVWEQGRDGRVVVVCSSKTGLRLDVRYYNGGWQVGLLAGSMSDNAVQLQLFANPSNNNIGFIKTSFGPHGEVRVGMWNGTDSKLTLGPVVSNDGHADYTALVNTTSGAWLNSTTAIAGFVETTNDYFHSVKWDGTQWVDVPYTNLTSANLRWVQVERGKDGQAIMVAVNISGELISLVYNGSYWYSSGTLATSSSHGYNAYYRPFYFAPRNNGLPQVTIGGVPATVSSSSSTQIVIDHAPLQPSAGMKTVVVTNPNGLSGSCSNCMEYVDPPTGLYIDGAGGATKMEFAASVASGQRTVKGIGINTNPGFCSVKRSGWSGCLALTNGSATFPVPSLAQGSSLSLRVFGERGKDGADNNGIYAPFDNAITYYNRPSFVSGQRLQGIGSPSFMEYVPRGTPSVQRTITGSYIGTNNLSCPVRVGGSPAGCATPVTPVTSNLATVWMPTTPSDPPYDSYGIIVYGQNGTDANGISSDNFPIIYYVNRPSNFNVNNSYVPANSSDANYDWNRTLTGTNIKNSTGLGVLNICSNNDANGCDIASGVAVTALNGNDRSFMAPYPRIRGYYAGRVYGQNGTDANEVYINKNNLLTYEDKPVITNITPQCYLSEGGGTTVSINGSNLFGRSTAGGSPPTSGGAKVFTLVDGNELNSTYLTTTTTPPSVSGETRTNLSLTTPPHAEGVVALRAYSEHGDDGNTLFWTEDIGLSFGNAPPIARINGIVQPPVIWTKLGHTVQLDGSSSSDPEQGLTYCAPKGIQAYSWSVVSPSSGYTGAPSNNASISFTPTATGKYNIKLEVTDSALVSYTNRTNATSVMVRTLPVWREVRQ